MTGDDITYIYFKRAARTKRKDHWRMYWHVVNLMIVREAGSK